MHTSLLMKIHDAIKNIKAITNYFLSSIQFTFLEYHLLKVLQTLSMLVVENNTIQTYFS